ncbi:MAG: DMT family transporter [Acidaminococcaceae bacterium]
MTNTKGILLTMLSAVTFGFAFTLGPMTYGAGGSNPVTLTFLRNFLSLPVLLAILWYQGISLKVTTKELWSLTILGGIGNAITTLMLFISFSLIDVGIATTIHFIYPVFVTIGCVLFYREKLGLQKIIALLIATSGIACFFFGVDTSAGFGGDMVFGLILAIASGVTYAFYIIYMDKSGLKNQPVFKITFYVALMSSIAMGIYGQATSQLAWTTLTPKSWVISTVFALLCTVVALSLLQIGIKQVGASTAAILTTFEPITSIICGVFLLGETVTMVKVIACALILTGVVTLSLSKQKKEPEAEVILEH